MIVVSSKELIVSIKSLAVVLSKALVGSSESEYPYFHTMPLQERLFS